MERDELAAWLRLVETPHLGRDAARRLLAALGSAEAVARATVHTVGDVAGPLAARALSEPPASLAALTDATLAWLAQADEAPRHVVALGDPLYPQAVLEAPDPPLLLYVAGHTELLKAPSIAIVGSRNPTAQGAENARAFAASLSQAGLAIVSGLALGIDGAAHEGALQGAGRTIAVVGTGLDIVYPRRHRDLARRISREGLLVSEHSLGTPSRAMHFPQRNRIIAGLARATLVVEAALQSGSLITARLAADAGRDVLAIPGSIHSPLSRGCHHLIKQGAKLVDSARDVLEEIGWRGAPSAPAPSPDGAARDPLLRALGHDPVSLDALAGRTGWSAPALVARLLELELEGRIARLPGQFFQRVGAR